MADVAGSTLAHTQKNPINAYDFDGAKPVFSAGECPSDEFDPDYIIYELYGIDIDKLKEKALQQQLFLISTVFPSGGSNAKAPSGLVKGRLLETRIRQKQIEPASSNHMIEKQGVLSYNANLGLKPSPLRRFTAGLGRDGVEQKVGVVEHELGMLAIRLYDR